MTPQTKLTRRRLAVKLNADSRPLVYGTVALVTVLGVVSLLASFQGLVAVSAWARLPHSLAWTVPVMLDGAILTYTAAALIRRARGESTRLAWTGVVAGTVLSASANAAHVALADGVADADVLRTIGAGIAALSPVLAALAVHQLADLAVAGPDEELAPARRIRRAARSVASQPVLSAPTAAAAPTQPAADVATVRARRPSSTTSASRTEREALRAEVIRLATAEPDLSHREIGERTSVAHTTVGRWLRAAAEQNGQDAAELAQDLLVAV